MAKTPSPLDRKSIFDLRNRLRRQRKAKRAEIARLREEVAEVDRLLGMTDVMLEKVCPKRARPAGLVLPVGVPTRPKPKAKAHTNGVVTAERRPVVVPIRPDVPHDVPAVSAEPPPMPSADTPASTPSDAVLLPGTCQRPGCQHPKTAHVRGVEACVRNCKCGRYLSQVPAPVKHTMANPFRGKPGRRPLPKNELLQPGPTPEWMTDKSKLPMRPPARVASGDGTHDA